MKNKAVLVGINQYPNPVNQLRGCVNDILDMHYFISEANKVYAKENIKLISDKKATKNEIVNALHWLISDVSAGDSILFHYSGHGAQVPTLHPDFEKDGLDEIICPYDFDGTEATTLRDKEFAQIFAKIPKDVHFVWISDSCHAEDLSRDPVEFHEHWYRHFQGANDLLIPNMQATPAKKLPTMNQPLQGALLSACASNELSADAIIHSRFNGAFTYYLIRNLHAYGAEKSMEEIIRLVNKDMDKNGFDQNPQSEGLLVQKKFFL